MYVCMYVSSLSFLYVFGRVSFLFCFVQVWKQIRKRTLPYKAEGRGADVKTVTTKESAEKNREYTSVIQSDFVSEKQRVKTENWEGSLRERQRKIEKNEVHKKTYLRGWKQRFDKKRCVRRHKKSKVNKWTSVRAREQGDRERELVASVKTEI